MDSAPVFLPLSAHPHGGLYSLLAGRPCGAASRRALGKAYGAIGCAVLLSMDLPPATSSASVHASKISPAGFGPVPPRLRRREPEFAPLAGPRWVLVRVAPVQTNRPFKRGQLPSENSFG